jgi:hypothetical protein
VASCSARRGTAMDAWPWYSCESASLHAMVHDADCSCASWAQLASPVTDKNKTTITTTPRPLVHQRAAKLWQSALAWPRTDAEQHHIGVMLKARRHG